MIKFIKLSSETPYNIFKEKMSLAYSAGQENIDAVCISSYSKTHKEVDSRYVNLKFIKGREFIFFSNYSSTKALQFNEHNQISAVFYWNKANIQIRIKGKIQKKDDLFNKEYFKKRDFRKNALAISSNQSKEISSHDQVHIKYQDTLNNKNLNECPEFWGGYSFTPYYFEFWEGHESRINKREVFDKIDDAWKQSFLQP